MELSQSSVRVLRVIDRVKLRTSLDMLVSQHSWRESLVQANPKEWWRPSKQQIASKLHPQISDINFGDMLNLSAMAVTRDVESTTVRLWWNWTGAPHEDWRFFCHLIDPEGAILDNYEITLGKEGPPSLEQPIRLSLLTFESAHG